MILYSRRKSRKIIFVLFWSVLIFLCSKFKLHQDEFYKKLFLKYLKHKYKDIENGDKINFRCEKYENKGLTSEDLILEGKNYTQKINELKNKYIKKCPKNTRILVAVISKPSNFEVRNLLRESYKTTDERM